VHHFVVAAAASGAVVQLNQLVMAQLVPSVFVFVKGLVEEDPGESGGSSAVV